MEDSNTRQSKQVKILIYSKIMHYSVNKGKKTSKKEFSLTDRNYKRKGIINLSYYHITFTGQV